MRELRLRTSLILLLITVVTLTFSLVGSTILLFRLPQIEARNRAELQERAASTSRLLDHYTAGIESQIRMQARLLDHQSAAELQAHLDAMVGEGEAFEAAYVVDTDGKVEALGLPGKFRHAASEMRGTDFSNSPLFRVAHASAARAAAAIWSDKYLSVLSGKHVVGVAVPAGDKVVIGEISLERVLTLLRDISSGTESLVIVVDRLGQWLASSQISPAISNHNYSALPAFQAIADGRPVPEHEDILGQTLLLGGSLSRNLRWVILTTAPAGTGSNLYFTTVVLVVGAFAGSLLLSMVLAPL